MFNFTSLYLTAAVEVKGEYFTMQTADLTCGPA